jgi:hypothetical protein
MEVRCNWTSNKKTQAKWRNYASWPAELLAKALAVVIGAALLIVGFELPLKFRLPAGRV